MVLEAFAIGALFDLARPLQRRFHRAETKHQVARPFVADARRAGNVVHRVALERQQVRHLGGRNTHELGHFGRVVQGVVLGRVEHPDALVHQLEHVLVAGNNDHVHAGGRRLPRDGSDHVVGLVARAFDHRHPHRPEQAADQRDLPGQVLGHRRAVGLVVREFLLAKRGTFAFKDRRQVLGMVRRLQLAQHVVENVDRLGLQPRRGPHGRGGRAGPGVIGAEDESEAVNQEQARPGHVSSS